MVKIKLLIYLLLACGVANAGCWVKLSGKRIARDPSATFDLNQQEREFPFKLPKGWAKCYGELEWQQPAYFAKIRCEAENGVTVHQFAVARPGKTSDESNFVLESPDGEDERWVSVTCTFP
jgi:hypothetical protein